MCVCVCVCVFMCMCMCVRVEGGRAVEGQGVVESLWKRECVYTCMCTHFVSRLFVVKCLKLHTATNCVRSLGVFAGPFAKLH